MPPNCLGQTACFSSPLGCVGAKLLMLGALLLAVLPFLRLLLGPGRDPIESPAKFGLYLTYVALTTALFVAAAAVLGEAAEHVLDSVDEHWAQIDLALPDDAFLCSGHRRNLFRSSAETSLSVLTTLASAAIVLLLSLIALTLYTRYATVGALLGASARDGAAGRAAEYAEGGTAAGALRGSHSLGNPSADASGAWWFSTSPVKRPPTHEPLIAEEGPDAHTSLAAAGRAGSAPLVPNGSPAGSGRYDGAGTADRYDAVDRYNYDGMRRGGSEGANHFVYGREQRHTYGDEQRHTARTSMLSNIDNDGLGQALMNNAALFPQWVSTSVPRLSCSMRLVLAVLATALAYVAGMVYFDAVGASAVPFEGAARQSRRMTLPFFLDYSLDYSSADIIPSISPYPLNFNLDGTLLSITNGFSHGTTTILLSNSKVAEIEVYLDVTSAHELADEVVLTNSSCTDSSNATWAEQVACYEPSYFQPGTGCASTKIFGCKSAQLNISAQPPASCDERCGWYWLWFPCRCHTSANLTIVLPTAAINANISAILNAPYSTALVISTPFLFQHAFINLRVDAPNGGHVRIAPYGDDGDADLDPSDVSSLLGKFAANNLHIRAQGDVRLEQVLTTGELNVSSGAGAVILDDIFAGSGVDAHAASLSVTDAFVAQPCFFVGRNGYLWVGGDACKDAAEPVGPPRPNVSDTEVAPPFGLMLGPLRLSASGAFPGAVLMNGTVISASAPMTARSGIMAYQGARFVGSMAMSFTDDEGRGSAANLNNVAVLDCSVCKPTADIGYLTWDDLPLSQDLPTIFCACPEPATRGILFESHDADLTALLAIASNLTAASTSGTLTLDEFVLTSGKPVTHLNGSQVGPDPPIPVINMSSTYGGVALNGLIATGAGVTYNVSLSSMAGDVKGLFTGGALDGVYEVVTAAGGIGHVGIVIDNEITRTASGHVGAEGNASVYLYHDYGDVSLAMSTKAPSVFSAITGSLTASGGSIFGAAAPAPTSAPAQAAFGRRASEDSSAGGGGDGGGGSCGGGEGMAAGGGVPVSSGLEGLAMVQRLIPGLTAVGAALLSRADDSPLPDAESVRRLLHERRRPEA